MKRRLFLSTTVFTTITAWWRPTAATPKSIELSSKEVWQLLHELQQYLLPSGQNLPPSLTASLLPEKSRLHKNQSGKTPGAIEVNAINYLRDVFSDPKMDPANKQLIIDGARQLNTKCHELHHKPFQELNALQREQLLREWEQNPDGERFLGKMLEYLIEGLLGSPIYGGNKQQLGWQWLNHNPGYPLPTADKKYYLL